MLLRPIASLAVAAALGVAVLLGLATDPARADEPVIGNILVPVERVAPGAAFPVTGYQLDPGVVVSFTLNQGAISATVGGATVGPDGTFSATATAPMGLADGYAELVATSNEGGRWVASVLIGAAAAPGSTTAVQAPLDPRLLALAVMAFGLVIVAVAGFRYLRR